MNTALIQNADGSAIWCASTPAYFPVGPLLSLSIL